MDTGCHGDCRRPSSMPIRQGNQERNGGARFAWGLNRQEKGTADGSLDPSQSAVRQTATREGLSTAMAEWSVLILTAPPTRQRSALLMPQLLSRRKALSSSRTLTRTTAKKQKTTERQIPLQTGLWKKCALSGKIFIIDQFSTGLPRECQDPAEGSMTVVAAMRGVSQRCLPRVFTAGRRSAPCPRG